MNPKKFILFSVLIFTVYIILSGIFLNTSIVAQETDRYRIMFYNVENLFDTMDDPMINDDEFLPEGGKHWNNDKFYKKLNSIYRVIISCGEWNPPAIVGLCEIENRFVLEQLVYNTPLKKFNYQIVHFESPDHRGIDVALLYRKSIFHPDTAYPIRVIFPFDSTKRTRDILYVKGTLGDKEMLHVFVNHWPSRYGGYMATIPKRNYAANVLRSAIDSVRAIDQKASILLMGDFNDGPYEQSMRDHLGAMVDTVAIHHDDLLNLTAGFDHDSSIGTLKYKGNWDVFDQLIVSSNMMDGRSGIRVSIKGAQIHKPDFLFREDETYLGIKPNRTYLGYRYQGGYSDHLPVYLDLEIQME